MATLAKEPQLDLAAVAARRAARYVDYFEGKGIVFERELESITVTGDAGRVEQIVDKLLLSGLRHARPGGTVRLRVRREGRDALLEVSDTGRQGEPPRRGSCFSVRLAARGQVPIPSPR